MPFNGSGTFSTINTFVPSTTISSSAVNANNVDFASNGLTNCVTRDGQGSMSAVFKLIPGTEAAPGLSFSSDLDTGMWRVSANTIGFSCAGSEVFELATTGASVIGDLDVSGTITGTFGAASFTTVKTGDGTVSLPSYAFTNDTDCGFYRIGANNIGFSIGGTKLVDYGAATLGVTGTLAVTGAATVSTTLGVTGASTLTGAVTMSTGGALSGTFTGAPTFSGNIAFTGTPTFSNPIAAKNAAVAFAGFTVSGTTVSFTSGNWQNVASVTRNSAGNFSIAFTSSLATANYVVVATGGRGSSVPVGCNATSKLVTGFVLNTSQTENGNPFDPTNCDFLVFGF